MLTKVTPNTLVVLRWHPSYDLDEIKRLTIQYPVKWIYDHHGHIDPNLRFKIADPNDTDKTKPITHETGISTDLYIDDCRRMMRYMMDLQFAGILPLFISGTLIPYKDAK